MILLGLQLKPHGRNCGFQGHPTHHCSCTPMQIQRYRSRISGPPIDRIDIQIEVPSVKYKELSAEHGGEHGDPIRERVNESRKVQAERFKKTKTKQY